MFLKAGLSQGSIMIQVDASHGHCFCLCLGKWGADQGGYSVAWNVAWGAGGGVTSVLWREECQGDVCCPGAPTCHDGERATNSERNIL